MIIMKSVLIYINIYNIYEDTLKFKTMKRFEIAVM